jgi:hypothetical protein
MTSQKTLALFLLFPHLADLVTPLPLIKLFYLIPSTFGFFYLERKDKDLLETPFTNND